MVQKRNSTPYLSLGLLKSKNKFTKWIIKRKETFICLEKSMKELIDVANEDIKTLDLTLNLITKFAHNIGSLRFFAYLALFLQQNLSF